MQLLDIKTDCAGPAISLKTAAGARHRYPRAAARARRLLFAGSSSTEIRAGENLKSDCVE
jgi:hypothetical protein